MTLTELSTLLNAARQVALMHYPYYSAVLTRIRFRFSTEIQGLACVDNNGCIYWNPDRTRELIQQADPDKRLRCLAFVILHECLHVLRDHHDRSLHANYPAWAYTSHRRCHHLWNISADLEINAGMRNWISLLPGSFRPLLPEDLDLDEENLAENYLNTISEEIADTIGFVDEGSGVFSAPGLVRIWESDTADGGEQSHAWTSLDRTLIRNEVAEAMLQSGLCPSRDIIWARRLRRRTVNWRSILKSRIKRAHTTDQRSRLDCVDFRRPSRLQPVSHPLIVPKRKSEDLFLISIVVDTSGSMNEHLLELAMNEVNQISRMMDSCTVDVLQCDEEVVAYEKEYRASMRSANTTMEVKGGRGTNMVLGVETALHLTEPASLSNNENLLQKRSKPGIVIVMTDGMTPFPDRKYDTPVLWCIIDNSYLTNLPAPWTNDDLLHIGSDSE